MGPTRKRDDLENLRTALDTAKNKCPVRTIVVAERLLRHPGPGIRSFPGGLASPPVPDLMLTRQQPERSSHYQNIYG